MGNFDKIAIEIDAGLDTSDIDRIKAAIDEIERQLAKTGSNGHPILHYFRANAFANLRALNPNFQEEQFAWQQKEFTEEILSLCRAVKADSFEQLDKVRQCQILTNLGNALNTIGRPIEAVAAWDKALSVEPKFAMAAANRAYGLACYSQGLYDPGHQCIFLRSAAAGFRTALEQDAIWDSEYPGAVRAALQTKLDEIENYLSEACNLDNFDPYGFVLGKESVTKAFNQWRLDHRLFLNPLNDLGAWPVAAQDIFHLPNHTYAMHEDPRFVKYYDQIKQEHVTACVLLYEGRDQDQTHAADETLLTYEHADNSTTSVGIEKQKAAFRLAYSLFDKCAAFINDYFDLGHNPKGLASSFRKVWFSDPKKQVLHPNLPTENWRLRGLFSLSLDIFDPDFKDLSSPLAVQANDVRNAAEHRFVSVHKLIKPNNEAELFEYVTVDELFQLSLHMLKLSRAAIIGLSMAVHHQENHLKDDKENQFILPISSIPKKSAPHL